MKNCNDGIYCLTEQLLPTVSEFLALPSRILFAIAMTSKSENFQLQSTSSTIAAAILPSSENGYLDKLDYSTVEKKLCAKLSDDDINASLLCINAQLTLKKMILSGCTNIVGQGLESLRGSTVLQMIDLSLVGKFESPSIKGDTTLSEDCVIPILQRKSLNACGVITMTTILGIITSSVAKNVLNVTTIVRLTAVIVE